MNILALDSSGEILSTALSTFSGVWYTEIDAGSRHSELMMECVDGLCKSSGLSPSELQLVACMQGPGSFTGLRIGFSSAKGIALALGIPFTAVPTLDCLAWPLSAWPGIVVPAMDAKKNCFFTALYRKGKQLSEYMDAPAELIAEELSKARLSDDEPVIVTGTGAKTLLPLLAECMVTCYTTLDPGWRRGRARELLEISNHVDFFSGISTDSGPLYLRKSDAELYYGVCR